eukprot:26313-Rhodomonas_salina.1
MSLRHTEVLSPGPWGWRQKVRWGELSPKPRTLREEGERPRCLRRRCLRGRAAPAGRTPRAGSDPSPAPPNPRRVRYCTAPPAASATAEAIATALSSNPSSVSVSTRR